MMSIQYRRNFRKSWLKHDDLKIWIEERIENGKSVVRCKYCHKSLNTKLSDLIKHSKSKSHLKACNIASSNKKIDEGASCNRFALKLARAEAIHSMFVAEHCAILSADHLSEIISEQFMPEFACKQTECTAIIIDVLAPYFKSLLKEDIGNNFFSLLIDESTDITTEKYIGVAIIYFSEKHRKINYTFLGLMKVENGEAQTIHDAILKLLKEFGLKVEKIRGIGTDNANTTVSEKGGLYALLKALNPNIVLCRYMNYSLQLAVCYAADENFPRTLDFIIENTYSWFSKSSNRQLKYKDLYNCIYDGNDPLKITHKCDTRWLSIEACVSRILDQWDALQLHFGTSRYDDQCYMAESLYHMYLDGVNKAYFKFFQPILLEIDSINKILQWNKGNHISVLGSLLTLIQSLMYMIIHPNKQILKKDVFSTSAAELKKILNPKPYLGFQFEHMVEDLIANKKITNEEADMIKKRCVNFIISLIDQFQKRLPDNVKLLKEINMFQPNIALQRLKDGISSLLEMFGYSELQITTIEKQWNDLHLIKWEKTISVLDFWVEVYFYEDVALNNPFNELATFALSLLILPHSNVEVERIFSQMNMVKCKSKNRMLSECLVSILYVRSGLKREQSCCSEYGRKLPENILKQVSMAKKYKKPIEGTTTNEGNDTDGAMEVDHDLFDDKDFEVWFS